MKNITKYMISPTVKQYKVGCSTCNVLEFDGVWILYNLFTPEEERGKGYATGLVKDVINKFRNSMDTVLMARTLSDNAAYRVFEKAGFKKSFRLHKPNEVGHIVNHIMWTYEQN